MLNVLQALSPRHWFHFIYRMPITRYHTAIPKVRRSEADIVSSRFATAISDNRHRDFWQEAKHLRCQLPGRRTLLYMYVGDLCMSCICNSYLRANAAVVGSLAMCQGTLVTHEYRSGQKPVINGFVLLIMV